MKSTIRQITNAHNKELLNAIMQESETKKVLRKIIREIGVCLN